MHGVRWDPSESYAGITGQYLLGHFGWAEALDEWCGGDSFLMWLPEADQW